MNFFDFMVQEHDHINNMTVHELIQEFGPDEMKQPIIEEEPEEWSDLIAYAKEGK